MTAQFTLRDIDQSKMDTLVHLFRTWNVETEVETTLAATNSKSCHSIRSVAKVNTLATVSPDNPFAEVFGMWEDYDIDAKQLRQQSWEQRNQPHLSEK